MASILRYVAAPLTSLAERERARLLSCPPEGKPLMVCPAPPHVYSRPGARGEGHPDAHLRVALLEGALLCSLWCVAPPPPLSCCSRATARKARAPLRLTACASRPISVPSSLPLSLVCLAADTLIDKAVAMQTIGGVYANQRPTEFLCLTLKLLQLQPEKEILMEYLTAEEFKSVPPTSPLLCRAAMGDDFRADLARQLVPSRPLGTSARSPPSTSGSRSGQSRSTKSSSRSYKTFARSGTAMNVRLHQVTSFPGRSGLRS